MKKTFPLQHPRKEDARVRDAIKHEVRKYVQREREKPLPAGFDRWGFDCGVGSEPANVEKVPLKEISRAIDRVAEAGGPSVYIQILAIPAHGRAPASGAA